MENQITSLMKQKYGMVKSSPLVFTEKDTLYTSFRKLADNIYKNGDWTSEDQKAAVNTMERNHRRLSVGKDPLFWNPGKGKERLPMTITVEELTEEDKKLLGNRVNHSIGYAAVIKKYSETNELQQTSRELFLLDPTNRTGTKHSARYSFESALTGERTYYTLGNMNRAIGYNKLQQDILKSYDSQAEKLANKGLKRENVEELLVWLSDAYYSGKKWSYRFSKNEYGELTDEFLDTLPRDESVHYWQVPPTKEQVESGYADDFKWRNLSGDPTSRNKLNLDKAPYILASPDGLSKRFVYPKDIPKLRAHNQGIAFVEKYIQDTYDIFLQREYEKDIEKQARASAWQTKKNINKETQEIMDRTSLGKHFGFIEVDNDVDLALFSQFEKEMTRIHALLPKTQETADLRLRKLGNYRALGMYHPLTKTIAIDFRDYKDDIQGIGLQAFIHEYAHFLDYTSEKTMLSLQPEFKTFVASYRTNARKLPKDSFVRSKMAYYGTPTEVWARAFELYVSETGLKSIFLKSFQSYQLDEAYIPFDSMMRKKLTEYFDKRFPELRQTVSFLNRSDVVQNLSQENTKKREGYIMSSKDQVLDSTTENMLSVKEKFLDFYNQLNDIEKSVMRALSDAKAEFHFAQEDPIRGLVDEASAKGLYDRVSSALPLERKQEIERYFDDNVHYWNNNGNQELTIFDMENLIGSYENEVIQSQVEVQESKESSTGELNLTNSLLANNDLEDNRYFQIEFNESNPGIGIPRYQGEIITPELIAELESFESVAALENGHYKFYLDEIVNGEVVNHHRLDIGDESGTNKPIYSLLKSGAVSSRKAAAIRPNRMVVGDRNQRKPKRVETEQPELKIPVSETETKEQPTNIVSNTVEETIDFAKIMQASSSNYLSEFKQALDDTFDLMEKNEEGTNHFLTKADVDKLLEDHLTKIEQMISSYTISANLLNNPTNEQKNNFLKQMLDNLKTEISQFREELRRTLTTKKDTVLFNVQDKTDSLRIHIKNSFNSRILKMNESIKKLVEKIDQTFVLEEKVSRSKNDLNAIEARGNELAVEPVEEVESTVEAQPTLVAQTEEQLQESMDNQQTESVNETDSTHSENQEEVVEEESEPVVQEEEPLDKSQDQVKKIEKLSKQLNLSITAEDKKAIENLSDEEKEGLIQELTTTISDNEKSISTEEMELEVG